jgi:2-methylisocitrate lyase-like PEP mutase family enzyme/enamine deaminase RidA (YjgF/YER057c/UK114 family)
MTHDHRLSALHLELPPAPKPVATYATAVGHGDLLYVAGHGPLRPDGTYVVGKVGADLDLAKGREAARLVGLAMLSTLKSELGSLDRVVRVVKVLGVVNATPEFTDHPEVVNGFSDLLRDVFGDAAIAARSAIGTTSLPRGIAVEIEAIFQIAPRTAPIATAAAFRALHRSGCFVLPNPWDVGSARFLQHVGFKALATTSAGVAFSRGSPDTVDALSRDAVLEHVRELVGATPLPVNADYQNGYAHDPEGVAVNVTLCAETGASGLSIEDATGTKTSPLYDRTLAVERIRAARRAIDATGSPLVLTARCEAWLVGDAEPFRTALDRLVAFAEAGADCLYAPGVRAPVEIAALVKAVAPKPLNVLVSAPGLTVAQLSDLGVRRISVGSALSRVAWGAFMRSARSIAESGTFDTFADAAPFSELNRVFGGPK